MFGRHAKAATGGTIKPATVGSPAQPGGGAKTSPLQPIEIFRAGRHISSNGAKVTITPDDLQACAENYDPDDAPAPLVVGHPKTDDPAYGWVQSLEQRDGKLYATPKSDVDPSFAEAVNEGKYNRVSAAFYAPNAPGNPKRGAISLKHVGFLGGVAPAVKGMKPARIVADTPGPLLFAECDLTFSDTPPNGGGPSIPETWCSANAPWRGPKTRRLSTTCPRLAGCCRGCGGRPWPSVTR